MEKVIADFLAKVIMAIVENYQHNWLPLLLAIITVIIMTVYLDLQKIQNTILKRTHISIWSSVAVGAFTPLCACGTMAVILGMLTTTMPWGPIMAFLTSSPLMSPDGFILNTGIISLQFAIALTVSSIVIGTGSGYITHLIETKTNFLNNQSRFAKDSPLPSPCGCSAPAPPQAASCGCGVPEPPPVAVSCCGAPEPPPAPVTSCGCGDPAPAVVQSCCDNLSEAAVQNSGTRVSGFWKKIKWKEMWDCFINIGVKKILLYFTIFVVIGYLVTYFIPNSLIIGLFGAQKFYGVPLAALIGLPLYVSTESMLPLINSLLGGGASGGSMLAFMITGPGTSVMVVAGLAVFMKKRALILYILFILFGAILCGYLYDLLLALGL